VHGGPEEHAAFKDLQAAIRELMTLEFSDPEKCICVFTSASDRLQWKSKITSLLRFCLASSKAHNNYGQ
jgi:hypothetical protein